MLVQPTLRRAVTLGFGAALVVAALPAVVDAAAGRDPAQVGAANYDRVRERLLVPVHGGQVPRVRIKRLAPRQYVADLTGSVLEGGEAQGQRLRSPALAGWSLDQEPRHRTVRLRMTLGTDVQPRLRFDRAAGGYWVSFASPAGEAPMAAKPMRARPPVARATQMKVAGKPTARPLVLVARPRAAAKPIVAVVPPAITHDMANRLTVRHLPRVARPAVVAVAAKPAPLAVVAKPAPRHHRVAGARPLPRVRVAGAPPAAPVVRHTSPIAVPPLVLAVPPLPAPRHATVAHLPHVRAHAPHAQVAHAPAQPRPTAVAAARLEFVSVGVPTFDKDRNLLVVPVKGDLTGRGLDVVRLSKRWAYIDVAQSRPSFSGVRYEKRADKLFQRWVMARRPGRDTTRLSFALGAPADIDVKPSADALLIAVRPHTTLLGAAPTLPTPRLVAAPGVPVLGAPVAPAATVQPPVAVAPVAPVAPVEAAPPLPAAVPPKAPVPVAARPKVPAVVAVAPRVRVRPVATGRANARREPGGAPVPQMLARRNVPTGTIETRLRRPFYDAERFGLVIPYEGRTPLYRWREKGEGRVELELKADVVSPAHLQPETRRHGMLGAWRFDRRVAAGTLTVEMDFARPSELVVAADAERKQLLLIPQPRLHAERAEETAPAHASLASVAMDRDGQNLYIPFNGDVPRYTIEQVNPSFAYVNFERSALRDTGVQFFAPDYHPTLNYWMVTQPEGTTTVRLAVALARPGAANVFQDKLNGRLVIVLGDNAPIVQASGPRQPKLPEPWPGAVSPGKPEGEPVSLREAS